MKYTNQISTSIPKQDLKEILDAIEFINRKVPGLVTLSAEEKASLPKMKSNTIDFVNECLAIAKNNPEIVPENVDIPEIIKDVELVKAANEILNPLKALTKKLKDSVLLAESEAYLPSIAIYNSAQLNEVKNKARQKKPIKTS